MDAGFARFLSFSAARQWLARVNLVLFGPAILRKCPFAIVERCVMVSVLLHDPDTAHVSHSIVPMGAASDGSRTGRDYFDSERRAALRQPFDQSHGSGGSAQFPFMDEVDEHVARFCLSFVCGIDQRKIVRYAANCPGPRAHGPFIERF
jgi:hypothetical protein